MIICFRRRRFLSDIFNTMLDVKWRYVHMAFFVSFIGSWLFFALIWWVTLSLLVVKSKWMGMRIFQKNARNFTFTHTNFKMHKKCCPGVLFLFLFITHCPSLMLTLHFFDTKTDDDVFYFLLGGSFCITTEILKRTTYLIIRKKQVQIHQW